MTAALSLSEQGYGVHLVERDPELGGLARNVRRTLEGDDVQKFLKDLVKRIENESNITVHLNTKVESTDGFVGNFSTRLENGATLDHGAILIATGGIEYVPTQYGYGSSEKIITQRRLENMLAEWESDPERNRTITARGYVVRMP
jgi:heterodisulfide reductase subunit A